MAQTSDRVSSIAGAYADITAEQIEVMLTDPLHRGRMVADIRSMAASLLRQDERKGLRGLVKKVFG